MDNMKLIDDRAAVPSLYELSGRVVYESFIHRENLLDLKRLPDPVIIHLIRLPLEAVDDVDLCTSLLPSFSNIDLIVWIRLLKYEYYRPTLLRFYQLLIEKNCSSSNHLIMSFEKLCLNSLNIKQIMKTINYGLTLGTFWSEGSWCSESEKILNITKKLIERLPDGLAKLKIYLECSHRLFHTLTMFHKFEEAGRLFNELCTLLENLDALGVKENYALLYTEFSRYCYHKNSYEESYKWIKNAMRCMNDKTAMFTQIQVLTHASRVCVVKHDFSKAKYLIHQALARAEQYYGSGHYKLGGLLLDFGFYLLNSDNIIQSVSIYRETYQLRCDTFGPAAKNLHVAIAAEDLAYALYVLEYSSGYFDQAMKYAERAIRTMKSVVPPGNLMLCSANRVKALILEEQALDSFQGSESEEMNEMLVEAEMLHKDALLLTKHTFGEENILTAKHYGNLGRLYQSMKKFKEAEEMHLKAIQLKEKILGPDDYEVGLSVGHLASLYNYQISEYKKAEQLYHRSISINLKLFSKSYSGLEYDYRGLIHVYEHLRDEEQFLKFSNKLHKWNALRSKCVSSRIGSDFYKIINIDPVDYVVNMFEDPAGSSAEVCTSRE